MTLSEQLRILNDRSLRISFNEKLPFPLEADTIDTLQINVGKRCNLNCRHCHVEAGPDRPELMDRRTFDACLKVLRDHPIGTIDITGGAPEMNPELPRFITEAARLERRLMVRSNLVILLEESYGHFLDLYEQQGVEITASLPGYHEERVNRQRGDKVFSRIIAVMGILNARGYGRPESGLVLNLVFNPAGAFLPGSQRSLQHEYSTRLKNEHGVVFNALYCLVNSPTGRFLDYLVRSDSFEDYMQTLNASFNPSTVSCLMCRNSLSVGWDGRLHDCDFNQMLDLTVDCGSVSHVWNFDYQPLTSRRIVTGNHCFSCTAGAGSSCQGALEI